MNPLPPCFNLREKIPRNLLWWCISMLPYFCVSKKKKKNPFILCLWCSVCFFCVRVWSFYIVMHPVRCCYALWKYLHSLHYWHTFLMSDGMACLCVLQQQYCLWSSLPFNRCYTLAESASREKCCSHFSSRQACYWESGAWQVSPSGK